MVSPQQSQSSSQSAAKRRRLSLSDLTYISTSLARQGLAPGVVVVTKADNDEPCSSKCTESSTKADANAKVDAKSRPKTKPSKSKKEPKDNNINNNNKEPKAPVQQLLVREYDGRDFCGSADALAAWMNARWAKTGYSVGSEAVAGVLRAAGRCGVVVGGGDRLGGVFVR
ncbi:hypothetical protein BKA81DRAFT_434890 [Phyllosticta paracitricarpa]|uniref:Uncharacterized protein n=1 Tax=Phyllosticta citricarpa TaxID=55181 RepID=A0ABR1LPU3_9PEZI